MSLTGRYAVPARRYINVRTLYVEELNARRNGPSFSWARYLVGGLLMGLGAAMVPGGNDVLVLHSIPGLSPHAAPAYGAMIAGIAAVLIMMRLIQGETMTVDCSGDICVSR